MSVQERIVRLAARLLPKGRREVRLEEWLADLEGCSELGISTWTVTLGALRDVATAHNLHNHLVRTRRRTWMAIGGSALAVTIVAVPGVTVAAYALDQLRGVVTSETTAAGEDITVHWRDYPGIAGITAEAVLAAPSLEQGIEIGEALSADLRARLSAVTVQDWEEESTDAVLQQAPNQFGGESLLVTANTPAWIAHADPRTAIEPPVMLDVIRDIGSAHGFTDLQLDPGPAGEGTTFIAGVLSDPHGQWLAFTIGTPPGEADDSTAVATLAYGANGLLPESARAEFERRVAGFDDFAQPDRLVS